MAGSSRGSVSFAALIFFDAGVAEDDDEDGDEEEEEEEEEEETRSLLSLFFRGAMDDNDEFSQDNILCEEKMWNGGNYEG